MRNCALPGLVSVYLFFLLNAGPAMAQEPFGCSSTQAESTFDADLSPSKVQIIPVTGNPEIARAAKGELVGSFDEIDPAKFGFKKIDFLLQRNTPKKPENENGYPPFTVYVRTVSPKRTAWWKVQEPPPAPTEDAFLTLNDPQPGSGDEDPVKILPAAESSSIPLYQMVWNRLEQAQWSSSVEAHLLLDFRAAQPKAVAQLACNSITAFGACGVYDAQHQVQNNFVCTWDPAKSDFNCEHSSWGGGQRTTKSRFELISNKSLFFEVKPGDPNSLAKFAQMAEADASWRGRQAELPNLGKTSHLLRLPVAHDQVLHIFGTYGDLEPFGANFYFVILTKTTQPQTGAIPVRTPLSEEGQAQMQSDPPATGTGSTAAETIDPNSQVHLGGDLSFGVKSLLTEPATHIYRITAREDGFRAVYWLAVETHSPDGTALIRGVKVASNGCSYQSCAHYATEASAASITIEKAKNFRAILDVEPSNSSSELDDNGGDAQPGCPYLETIEWNRKQWAVVASDQKCSSGGPRQIAIADDGTITATRDKVAAEKN